MPELIISRSKRGLFSVEEWELFGGNSTDPKFQDQNNPYYPNNDKRKNIAHHKCETCTRLWDQPVNEYLAVDIVANPIQCQHPDCLSYNITTTYVILDALPATYNDAAHSGITNTETQVYHPPGHPNHNDPFHVIEGINDNKEFYRAVMNIISQLDPTTLP